MLLQSHVLIMQVAQLQGQVQVKDEALQKAVVETNEKDSALAKERQHLTDQVCISSCKILIHIVF